MKKILLLFLFFGLFIFNDNLALAKNEIFWTYKKVPGGIMIGVEIFDNQSKKRQEPNVFVYSWESFSLNLKYKSYTNVVFLPIRNLMPQNIDIKLTLINSKNKKTETFEKKITISAPKVKIIKKRQDLPYWGNIIRNDDVLIVEVDNFSSLKFSYYWEMDNNFLSNEKELLGETIPQGGYLRIKVIGKSPNELASAEEFIQKE